MLFDFDIIIPAHTPSTNPVETRVRLTWGTLTEIRVMFPPGPATLVHVTVSDRLLQLMPANPDGDLNFDDAIIRSLLEYDIVDAPYELIVRGWSPDAVYAHSITVQCEMQPQGGQSWTDMLQHLLSYQGA